MKNSIEALVGACSDEDPPVRLSARDALLSASKVHATVVMRSLRKWMDESKSKNLLCTMYVLNVTRDVVQETLDEQQRDLDSISENLVDVTMKELMRTGLKATPPKAESPNANVENAARNCLVALSMRIPDIVCDSLLDKMKIKSGKQVPRAIVETIGSVAKENPKGFTAKAREVFSEISPMLGTMKVPSLRSVAANALARCCEAVIENDTMSFTSEALAVYKVGRLWMKDDTAAVRSAAVEMLGRCMMLLDADMMESMFCRSVDSLLVALGNARSTLETLSVVRSIHWHVRRAHNNCKSLISSILSKVLIAFVPYVVKPPKGRDDMLLLAEVLRCVETMASSSQEIFDFVQTKLLKMLGKMKAEEAQTGNAASPASTRMTIASLVFLKHLISYEGKGETKATGLHAPLLAALRPMLGAEKSEPKSCAVLVGISNLAAACATKGVLVSTIESVDYVTGAKPLVSFVLRQCAIRPELEGNRTNASTNTATAKFGEDVTTKGQIRRLCDNVLLHIVRQAPRATVPILMQALQRSEYAPAQAVLVQGLLEGWRAIKRQARDDVVRNLSRGETEKVFARLAVMSFASSNGRSRRGPLKRSSRESLKLLASHILPKSMKISSIEDEDFFQNLRDCVDSASDSNQIWIDSVSKALLEHLSFYAKFYSKAPKSQPRELRAACVRMIGLLTSSNRSPDAVRVSVEKMLNVLDHRVPEESSAFAEAMGVVSSGSRSHYEACISILSAKLKSVSSKLNSSDGGWFSSFVSSGPSVQERSMCNATCGSIALALGQIARCDGANVSTHILSDGTGLLSLARRSVKDTHVEDISGEILLQTRLVRALRDVAAASSSKRGSGMRNTLTSSQRTELLKLLLCFMRCSSDKSSSGNGSKSTESTDTKDSKSTAKDVIKLEDLRHAGVEACTQLMIMDPSPESEELCTTISALTSLWDQCPWPALQKAEPPSEELRGDKDDPHRKLSDSIAESLEKLLMGGQESVIQSELSKRLQAKRRRCRFRAVRALHRVVHSMRRICSRDSENIRAAAVTRWLPLVLPRCMDSVAPIRVAAASTALGLVAPIKRDKEGNVVERNFLTADWRLELLSGGWERTKEQSTAFCKISNGYMKMIVRDLSSALPSLFAALLDATNDLDKSAGAGAAMAIQVMVNGSVKHAQQDVKFVVSALVRNILSCLERTRSCLERAEDAFSTARRKVATATRQKKGPTRMSLIDMRGKRVCLEALQCTQAALLDSIRILASSASSSDPSKPGSFAFGDVMSELLRAPTSRTSTHALRALVSDKTQDSVCTVSTEKIRILVMGYLTDSVKSLLPLREAAVTVPNFIPLRPWASSSSSSSSSKTSKNEKNKKKEKEEEESEHVRLGTIYASLISLYDTPALGSMASSQIKALFASLLLGIANIHYTCMENVNKLHQRPEKNKKKLHSEMEKIQKQGQSLLERASKAMRALLQCAKAERLIRALDETKDAEDEKDESKLSMQEQSITYRLSHLSPSLLRQQRSRDEIPIGDTVREAVSTFCRICGGSKRLFAVMIRHLTTLQAGQRLAASASLSSAIPYVLKSTASEKISDAWTDVSTPLLRSLKDDVESGVREYAVMGIGTLMELLKTPEMTRGQDSQTLDVVLSIMHSMNDSSDRVQRAALDALRKTLPVVSTKTIRAHISAVCANSRSALSKTPSHTRRSALDLWKLLFETLSEEKCVRDSAMKILPSVIVHLRGRFRDTRVAAMSCLFELLKVFKSGKASDVLSKYVTSSELTDFDGFLLDFLPEIFKSNASTNTGQMFLIECHRMMERRDDPDLEWAPIMANAAILAASVILKVKKEVQQQMNVGQICDSLVELLRSNVSSSKNSSISESEKKRLDRGSSHTRSRAAQALGLLASIRK